MNHPEPPAQAREIIDQDRSHLRDLDPRGWRTEVRRLWNLLNPLDAKWVKEWGLIFGDPSQYSRDYIGFPIVSMFDREERGVKIPALALPALLVRLNVPDGEIMEQFKAALKEARKTYPPPVSNPGRDALNARFTKRTFVRWRNHKISQVAELLAWRNGLDEAKQKQFPNALLGKWLGFDDKQIHQAVDLLYQVIENFPALDAQVVAEAERGRPLGS